MHIIIFLSAFPFDMVLITRQELHSKKFTKIDTME